MNLTLSKGLIEFVQPISWVILNATLNWALIRGCLEKIVPMSMKGKGNWVTWMHLSSHQTEKEQEKNKKILTS